MYENADLPDGRTCPIVHGTPRELVPMTQMKNNFIILDRQPGISGIRGDRGGQLRQGGQEGLGGACRSAHSPPHSRADGSSSTTAGIFPKSPSSRRISTARYDGSHRRLLRQGHRAPQRHGVLFPAINPATQCVFGFNVGDDFACFTEEFVVKEQKNGVVNFRLEGCRWWRRTTRGTRRWAYSGARMTGPGNFFSWLYQLLDTSSTE